MLVVALVGLGPRVSGPAAASTGVTAPIGDDCLVGQWSSGAQTFFVRFHGVIEPMRGLRGTQETDEASGASTTSWALSRPAHSWLLGHRVREVVRGYATSVAHARDGQLSFTHNVAHHLVERFTYRGHTSVRRLDGHFHAQRSTYTCTAVSYATPAGNNLRLPDLP